MSPRITEMYAFVISDKDDDDEGVIGMHTLEGWVPFVGADTNRVAELAPIASTLATQYGKPIRVMRFSQSEVIDTIQPEPKAKT